jgi:transposase
MLDRGSYFYAKDLWEFVSDERSTECVEDTSVERVCGSPLQVWYLPPRLPELNPLEGCWNQLKEWFKYRLITGLDELKESLLIGFEKITEPDIYQYLCP